MYFPWVEKYRPRKIDDILQQNDVKNFFLKIIKNAASMPHLILCGPPGTGKTSITFALCNELFGPTKLEERVLELNASDNKGISTVRNDIVRFAKTELCNPDPKYPSPNIKLIILDEADAMTSDAQTALRKIMEKMCAKTRFIFLCNYVNKIIEPIISRCASFKFKPISIQNITNKLISISKFEKLNITVEACQQVAKISDGDIRRSISLLQNLKYLDANITLEKVNKIISYIDVNMLEKIWKECANGDICTVKYNTNKLIKLGYSINDILKELCIINVKDSNLSSIKKAKIAIYLTKCERRLFDEGSEEMHLLSLFTYINAINKNVFIYQDDEIF